mmetsp:Transcript_56002/g.121915  ORF Transcript_56002/g.121915 Transcript_56002/m.121915 type:complete len:258 (+) Transcript_56002:284-1057(+)
MQLRLPVTICTVALSCRVSSPYMNIFPADDGTGMGDDVLKSAADDLPPDFDNSPIGFWKIFDDLAWNDALKDKTAGANPSSFFSETMVLRADGQTSRGSDFSGGEWKVVEMNSQRRLWMTLRNKLQRIEWRYDGLFLTVRMPEFSKGAVKDNEPNDQPTWELQVIGKASPWNVSSAEAPVQLGEQRSFSMVKVVVDRTQLVPTVKPYSRELSVEEMQKEMAEQRKADEEDADELRRLIRDVKRKKQAGEWPSDNPGK